MPTREPTTERIRYQQSTRTPRLEPERNLIRITSTVSIVEVVTIVATVSDVVTVNTVTKKIKLREMNLTAATVTAKSETKLP
ncbi:hypothetical protein CWO07_23985 [Vibrio splendidus]|uniref:Uncharacterized protein n=1 Tax=Vibrio splendidus TaxID=29497 RepID=A0A2T5EC36_VIBSP|nr:hypothetical protein CWO07_25885 [Vibrio splendidus]PTP20822.1 hypothetical protein CWO07_23985 [Vibrio splendidus]